MTVVTGDPASMRAGSAQLRLRAETLTGVAADVDCIVECMTYSGPAADRFRGSIATNSGQLRSLCDRMWTVADTLDRQAAVVEEQLLQQANAGRL